MTVAMAVIAMLLAITTASIAIFGEKVGLSFAPRMITGLVFLDFVREAYWLSNPTVHTKDMGGSVSNASSLALFAIMYFSFFGANENWAQLKKYKLGAASIVALAVSIYFKEDELSNANGAGHGFLYGWSLAFLIVGLCLLVSFLLNLRKDKHTRITSTNQAPVAAPKNKVTSTTDYTSATSPGVNLNKEL